VKLKSKSVKEQKAKFELAKWSGCEVDQIFEVLLKGGYSEAICIYYNQDSMLFDLFICPNWITLKLGILVALLNQKEITLSGGRNSWHSKTYQVTNAWILLCLKCQYLHWQLIYLFCTNCVLVSFSDKETNCWHFSKEPKQMGNSSSRMHT